MTVPELRTPRLRLRPLTEADRDAVPRVFAHPDQSRFLRVDLSDPVRAGAMFDRWLTHTGPAGPAHWAIERDGDIVGFGHLIFSTELPGGVPEVGYDIDRAHAGQGLATEAAKALLEHGFRTLGLPVIWALIHQDNAASRKVAHNLGFLDVGGGTHYGDPHRVLVALPTTHGRPHHLELWVPDLARAERSWGWLLIRLGWREERRWNGGISWRLGPTYLVAEASPARTADTHERTRPGLNHLALHVATRTEVDALTAAAGEHGWSLLFPEKHPYAGGEQHYAAFLADSDGFEVELVASEGPPKRAE